MYIHGAYVVGRYSDLLRPSSLWDFCAHFPKTSVLEQLAIATHVSTLKWVCTGGTTCFISTGSSRKSSVPLLNHCRRSRAVVHVRGTHGIQADLTRARDTRAAGER